MIWFMFSKISPDTLWGKHEGMCLGVNVSIYLSPT
jgi:hypothetical protein